ncbi:MAG: hypothetical protein ACRDU5_13505 [Mycobacterium sp.]
MWPAAKQLGDVNGLGLAAAILGLPIVALLALSGASYYGVARSVVIAVVLFGGPALCVALLGLLAMRLVGGVAGTPQAEDSAARSG